MFYDQSINTKIVKLARRSPGLSRLQIHTQWPKKKKKKEYNKALHCTKVYMQHCAHPHMYVEAPTFQRLVISADLKPSRQCSCRPTHTGSYTICQVQNTPVAPEGRRSVAAHFSLAQARAAFEREACGEPATAAWMKPQQVTQVRDLLRSWCSRQQRPSSQM